VTIYTLDAARATAWAALFEACGSACFCRFWHFEGTKNDWLARCAEDAHTNRDEQLTLALGGTLAGGGLLAFEQSKAIGWMKLAPRSALPKLLRQGAYRSLPLGASEGVWSIGCLLVHPERRGAGVARALVLAAHDYVVQWGGRAIEAYPRRAGHRLHDEEAWMGTADLFASCGFVEVSGETPYPVMRRDVETNAGQPTTRPADSTRPP
jgi:GNAT superfamily N-acetyltransferase